MKQRALTYVGVTVALFGGVTTGNAQACLGNVSFRTGPVAVAARASFTKASRAFGATASVGQALGVFGSAGITRSIFDEGHNELTSVEGNLGYEIALTPTRRSTLCPLVSVLHANDPDYPLQGETVELTENDIGFGMFAGGAVRFAEHWSAVAFFGFMHYSTRARLSDGTDHVTTKDGYGTFALGAGLARQRVSFTPSLSIPLGLENAKTIIRLRAQMVVGHR